MNARYNRLATAFASLIVPLMLASQPASARATSCEIAQAPSLDSRLAAKVAEGPMVLRRFIQRTQTIYGLDWSTALARADRFNNARAACLAGDAS